VSRIYITNENGAQTEHSELEARQLVRQGIISKRARYWKSGMAESRPVAELLQDAALDSEEEEKSEGWVERLVAKVREFFQGPKK
jgi:hypothetical protein